MPVYVVAMVVTTAGSFISDHYKRRCKTIIIGFTAGALGFIALIAFPHPKYPGVTYGFLFLAASDMYMTLCSIVCWVANNLALRLSAPSAWPCLSPLAT
jgi:hypothetical protein